MPRLHDSGGVACVIQSEVTIIYKFSSLRRIKTFLRSSMAQQCLNNLFLLYVHTEQTELLDLMSVARDFMSVNSRRLNYLEVVLYLLHRFHVYYQMN